MSFRRGIFLFFWLCLPLQASEKSAAENALASAQRTVASDPQNGAAHVRMAIALGKMTDFTDNRTKMEYARLIRQEAETGLRLDPKNDVACLILAKWHDAMSRLHPILRAVATTIYGEMPEASAAEAESYFRRAARLAPQKISPHGELALFLERKSDQSGANAEWQKVLLLPPQDAEDRAFLADAHQALR